uniref:MLP-like protein 328 n=1 Tax=Rhizophora mucronata TaxID=61149 RepID=A0A2P2K165_RHIMU
MANVEKLEVDLGLKCSADQFFKFLSTEIHQIGNTSSDKIQNVRVNEGDWKTHGSIKEWKYTIDGKTEIFKEKVEVDEVSKTVSFVAVGGHILDQYKSYKIVYQAVPKDEGTFVRVKLEYEKLKSVDPRPNKYLELLINVVKDIDAHVVKAGGQL